MRLRNSSRARRGSILIVVIGLLALFAVVGLSFVLYADAEATAARSARAARNDDALPDPAIPAQDFLRQLIFDTADVNSSLRGHGLLTSRFENGSNVPFTGTGLAAGTTNINYTGAATAQPTGKAVPWTYPDLNNFYLAWLDPTTGKVTVPSFHRSGIFPNLAPNSPYMDPSVPANALKTLRPHPSKHPNFPKVPANPDGTYTGDVSNLKFMTGSQSNDSLWMYAGSPVQTWRGRQYVAMVAPLILDLSGRVNLSVAGNNRAGGTHGSTHGFGPWEINPLAVLGAGNQADLTALITARYNGLPIPGDRNSSGGTTSLINRGRNSSNVNESRPTPFYSRLDVDCVGSAPDGPPNLPAANGLYPFPDYTSRFDNAGSTAAAHANHMSMFNPFQWPRGAAAGMAHGFGMDDLVKLASRYNDPKNRYNTAEIAQKAPTSMANSDVRHLTTAFSVSQRWGRLPVNGGAAYVGPIDLNRPLPDYRSDTTNPISSTNIVTGAQLITADNARQNLAMDVFVRLLAAANLVDGTNVIYAANTGRVTFTAAPTLQVKQLAQFAVNIVDYIDGDDIMTAFVWHDNTDIVYGTELPKLVVNEAYSAMFNDDMDSAPPIFPMVPMNMKRPAKQAAKKKFWVELQNPLKADATLPDSSAARLRGVDANNVPINVYELLVAEDTAPPGLDPTSYTQYLGVDPSRAATDPAASGIVIKLRVNDFNTGTANPALGVNERFLVQPLDGATAVAKGNQAYYVVGPKDRNTNAPAAMATTFPDKQDANLTYSFVPQAGGTQTEMEYPATNGAPTPQEIDTAKRKLHTVILRRLANPYLALNANTNPYVTVDLMEGVKTHDRVEFDDTDKRQNPPMDDEGSIGKRHPYATGAFDPTDAQGSSNALAIQTGGGAAPPPHTFFAANSNLDNKKNGLAWLTHLDRELVNATELLQVSVHSPALLTNKFFAVFYSNTGQKLPPMGLDVYNSHNRPNYGPAGLPSNYGALLSGDFPNTTVGAGLYKAFDLLAVASRLPQVPLGGREPGLVNVNAINDARVAAAVLDPQAGNSFDTPYATQAWSSLVGSRGAIPALNDKPFKPYSAAATADESLFRGIAATGRPFAFNPTPINVGPGAWHPYFVPEPLRKVMNNTTTVTDGFLVIWTVGFFEVESAPGVTPLVFGKELFERVPGDLRSQYTAVVDRSMATVATAGVPATAAPFTRPWETKVTDYVATNAASAKVSIQAIQSGAGFAIYDGDSTPVTLAVGSQIRIGHGDFYGTPSSGDGEWVNVVSVSGTNPLGMVIPGQVTLTVSPVLPATQLLYHGAGTRVSNGLLGAPTPAQVTTFNAADPANRHIVPYYIRMQP